MCFSGSVEYKTLKDNIETLKLAISSGPQSVGAKLVNVGLVSHVMYKMISTSSASESDRAAGVLELVEQKVLLNPQCYYTFVAVLLDDEMHFGSILQKLQDTYQSYEQKVMVQGSLQQELSDSAAMDCLLTLNDKAEVVEYIHGLSRRTLIQLGCVLGLHYHSQGKTTSSDIAHSWLKTCDNVLTTSGQPTWSTLVTALQRIGRPDVASHIIMKKTDDPTEQHNMETDSTVANTFNVADVLKGLITIAARWLEVGIYLGLDHQILKEIESNYFHSESRFRTMIAVWLKGNGVPVTWTSLISALEKIDERRLAETLRDKFTLPSPRGNEDDSLAHLAIKFSSLDGETYKNDQLSHLLVKLSDASLKWRDIGASLGFKMSELDNIQAKPSMWFGAPNSYLSNMLTQWLHWAPGDRRGSTGFATREVLRYALRSTGFFELSEDLPPGYRTEWTEARMMAAKPKIRY